MLSRKHEEDAVNSQKLQKKEKMPQEMASWMFLGRLRMAAGLGSCRAPLKKIVYSEAWLWDKRSEMNNYVLKMIDGNG